MENEKEALKFPPPPDYYKEFKSPTSYKPPDLSIIEKLGKFSSFGNENDTKKLHISFNLIDPDKKTDSKSVINNELFKKLENNEISIDNLDINFIEELEKEIKLLKTRYNKLLEKLSTDIYKTKRNTCLIALSIQKIHFCLIALRRKSILQKTINFLKKNIKDCEKTVTSIDEGEKNFRDFLEQGLKEFK